VGQCAEALSDSPGVVAPHAANMGQPGPRLVEQTIRARGASFFPTPGIPDTSQEPMPLKWPLKEAGNGRR
jgi:hypothetical protein